MINENKSWTNTSPEERYKQQVERDHEMVMEIARDNLKALEPYSDDEEVVITEESFNFPGKKSKHTVKVGEAREAAAGYLKMIEEDTDRKLNYNMETQHNPWYVDPADDPNKFQRMKFARSKNNPK